MGIVGISVDMLAFPSIYPQTPFVVDKLSHLQPNLFLLLITLLFNVY